jgi:crossover junction endodeoxyribonuclease RusA
VTYRVVYRFVLPVGPSANDYWRPVRSRIVDTDAARAYKERTKLELLTQGVRPVAGPLAVWLHWHRKTLVRADLGNRIKVLEDALNRVAWDDDSQIEEIHAYRHHDPANPRVELTVAIIEQDGRDG